MVFILKCFKMVYGKNICKSGSFKGCIADQVSVVHLVIVIDAKNLSSGFANK